MKSHAGDSIGERLAILDREIRQRAFLANLGYSLGMVGAVMLCLFFPFPLSRVGSTVLMIALGYMLWKVHEASHADHQPRRGQTPDALLEGFGKVDAQIKLIESMIYNLPFMVGANLFFIGLPGTGSAESKAWLDCFFLLGTILVFGGCYFANQQIVRRQLLPLRRELARSVLKSGE